MTIAEYTAKVLLNEGVRYLFGIPGGPSIPFIEAWRDAGIEFILSSHEAAAAVMADVTARVTGTPGACHATFGPGAVNMASGTGGALLDRSPLIAFTTEMPAEMQGRTTQMGIDHQQLYNPLTKATFRLSPGNAASVLPTALRTVKSELPGPVHIGLPADIALKKLSRNEQERRGTEVSLHGAEEKTDSLTLREAERLLRSARRPVIAVGLTAARLGVSSMLKRFLERAPMPVLLTPMAKGVLENRHPCYAGVLFHALSDMLRPVTEGADLVIGIGYDPVEYNYESWVPDVPVIHLSTRPVDMPRNMKSVAVTGQPADWFGLLDQSGMSGDYLGSRGVAESISGIQSIFSEMGERWGPVNVLKTLRGELPQDAVITLDVGSHLHVAGQYWPADSTGRVVMTNGWSSMGFGLPSAIAVKLNSPDTTVVAVTGDGGFLMSAGEMMTARRYNVGIRVVVIADRELNLIKVKKSWRNLDHYGTELMRGELFGCDSFLGVPVFNADSENSMLTALKSAMSVPGPAIVCASVPGDDYNRLIVRQ